MSQSSSRHVVIAVFAGILAAVLAIAPPAGGTPRYSMRVGQDCLLCHQSPSGGGMRSEYASQYLLPERLVMRPKPADDGTPQWLPNPRVGDDLVVGADLRTFHLASDVRESGNNFLEMQGAVYLSLQLSPSATAYVHEEFGAGGPAAFEIWGQAFFGAGLAWVKAGKFVPAFGWRRDDHRAFTRREYVILPPFPPHADTGVEIGVRRHGALLQLAVTNGDFADRDLNDEIALSARGEVRRDVGVAHVVLGGSYWQHRGTRGGATGRTGEDVWAGGPLAGVRWGPAIWLGELDWTHREVAGPASGARGSAVYRTLTTSQELSWEIVQGLEAVAVYDFHDVDVDRKSGAVTRFGFGVDARPRPWLGLGGAVHFYRIDDGPDLATRASIAGDATETIAQVHFLY